MPFSFIQGGEIAEFQFDNKILRSIVNKEAVWFVAKDVCDILEHSQVSKAVERLDDDEKLLGTIFLSGQNRETWLINESGLYSLILTSRKAEARKFKKWITHDVLPAIRKTGGYVSNEDLFLHTYLPHADDQTKLMFRATLETVRKQNEQISLMQPKADYFDALVDRNLLTNFRDTAKELEVGERQFVKWLLENKYLYRDKKSKLKPYSRFVPEIFKLKEYERNGRADVQTLITPKGKETFRILMKKLVS
ncbi:BRO family protein [Cytobacillus firmus]|uniref:Antirepressor protein n=1 Tax=Cytobacillus firmus DS1 TaxID=1307436 RepID=W7L024_CYTFI|nr:BRO family protein [Cytobacillus firmus]EWG08886.1 antirepressor protein [Cytobacillus firmus DS1]